MNTPKRILSSVLFLALALPIGGCEKSADLGRIQEETLAIVKLHQTQVDVLQRRADALMTRGRTLGGEAPGIADAGRLLSEARAGLDQLRAQLTAAPGTLGNAVKSNNLDEVEKTSDELLEKLDSGEVAVRSNLAAVDSWLMSVENRPATPTPPAAPAVKEETPPAPPATGGEAGSAAGSAAAPPK